MQSPRTPRKSLHEAGQSLEKLLRVLNGLGDDDEGDFVIDPFGQSGYSLPAPKQMVNGHVESGICNFDDGNKIPLSPVDSFLHSRGFTDNKNPTRKTSETLEPFQAGSQNSRGFDNYNKPPSGRNNYNKPPSRGLNKVEDYQSLSDANTSQRRRSKFGHEPSKTVGSMITNQSSSLPDLHQKTNGRHERMASPMLKSPNQCGADQRCSELEEQIRQLSNKVQNGLQQIQGLQQQLSESRKSCDITEKREQELRGKVQTLRQRETELVEKLNEMQSASKGDEKLRSTVQSLRKNERELVEKLNEAQSALKGEEKLRGTVQSLRKRESDLEEKLKEAQSELKGVERQRATIQSLRKSEAELEEKLKEAQSAVKRAEELRGTVNSLRKRETELVEKLNEAESQLKKQVASKGVTLEAANDAENGKRGGKSTKVSKAEPGEANVQNLEEENQKLVKELHDKNFELQRMENHQEKVIDDYATFVQCLASSSSTPMLDKSVDLKSTEILGMGNYGFVVLSNDKEGKRLVVKLQSQRWVAVAVQEWAHGSVLGAHKNIVTYVSATMHRDDKKEVSTILQKGFQDGSLTGKKPKVFPDVYFCLALEYMNRGTVQNFMDKGLLAVEGVAAVTRQAASALAFIHQKKQTHNDIKPENILLADVPGHDHLIVKLADLGLAEHSVQRKRDCDLFAYTVWCMGLNERFGKVLCSNPEASERDAAVARFQKHIGPMWSELVKVVSGHWQGKMEPGEVKDLPKLQSCEVRIQQSKAGKAFDLAELEEAAKHDVRRRTLHMSGRVSVMLKRASHAAVQHLAELHEAEAHVHEVSSEAEDE